MTAWDRTKFLMLLAVLFNLLVWNEYLKIEPEGSWADASRQISATQPWILVLTCIEVLRQMHLRISELSSRYHGFWTEKVFGRVTRAYERRFGPWTRFRIARVAKWLFWIAVIALVLGKVTGSPPVIALF